MVHPEQPKAQADGQLVTPNSTSVPAGTAPTSGAQGVGGAPGADAGDAVARGVGNPNAAPTNSTPETATRGTGMGSGDAGNRGSPGTRETASNSSAGSTTHPGTAGSTGATGTAGNPGSTGSTMDGAGGAGGHMADSISQSPGNPGQAAGGSPHSPGAGAHTPGMAAQHGRDHVLGNLGELTGAEGQPATMRGSIAQLTGVNLEGLVGRSVVIHEKGNDPNVPDGAAGTPIACGVIGMANPTPPTTGALATPPAETRTGSNRTGASGAGRTGKQQGTP
jgi:Cu/Zn superoxide dismutase